MLFICHHVSIPVSHSGFWSPLILTLPDRDLGEIEFFLEIPLVVKAVGLNQPEIRADLEHFSDAVDFVGTGERMHPKTFLNKEKAELLEFASQYFPRQFFLLGDIEGHEPSAAIPPPGPRDGQVIEIVAEEFPLPLFRHGDHWFRPLFSPYHEVMPFQVVDDGASFLGRDSAAGEEFHDWPDRMGSEDGQGNHRAGGENLEDEAYDLFRIGFYRHGGVLAAMLPPMTKKGDRIIC